LQKRPIILRSLLIEATPYQWLVQVEHGRVGTYSQKSSLFLSFSFCLSLCPSLSPFLPYSLSLSLTCSLCFLSALSLSFSLSLSLSLSVSLSLSLSLSRSFSIPPSLTSLFSLCFTLSGHFALSRFLSLSLSLSLCQAPYLSGSIRLFMFMFMNAAFYTYVPIFILNSWLNQVVHVHVHT